MGTKRHQSFVHHLPKPSPRVGQRRRAKWIADMEEAEAKQMELVCQRQEALAQKLKFKLVADKDSKGDEAGGWGKNSKRRIQRIILSTIFSPTATQQTENKIQNNKQTK